jgi:DNA-binding transcriptional LysR family regulator
VTGRLELALVGEVSAAPAGIATQIVADEPLAAAVSSHDPLAARASRGVSVAILTRAAAGLHAHELRALAITHPRLHGRLQLAWRSDAPTGPAARALVDHARAHLADEDTAG